MHDRGKAKFYILFTDERSLYPRDNKAISKQAVVAVGLFVFFQLRTIPNCF